MPPIGRGCHCLRQRAVLLALVRRVEVGPDQVTVHLRPRGLAAFLEDRLNAADPLVPDDEPSVLLSHPVRLRRAGKEVRIVIDGSDPFAPPPIPDHSLIKAIVNAHRFNDQLVHGGVTSRLRKKPAGGAHTVELSV